MSKKEQSLWTLPFILILLASTLNAVSTQMVNPNLPAFLLSKGAVYELTGVISSLLSWVALVIRPFSGAASDRFNRKTLMVISYLASAACVFLYTVSDNLVFLVAVRILHGIAFSLSGTISMAFSTSFIPVERIGEGLGYLTISQFLATTLGPELGDRLHEGLGQNWVFWIACIFNLLGCLIISRLPYTFEKKEQKAERKFDIRDFYAPELTIYVFLVALFSFGNGIVSYYLKLFGQERNIERINLFYSVNSLALLIVKPLSGKLLDKKGVAFILYPAYIFSAISFSLLANAWSLLPVLVAAVFKAVGQGIGTPAIQAESVKKCGVEKSGVAISTCFIGQDIGNGLGPIFASMLKPKIGFAKLFYVYVGMLLLGELTYFLYHQKEKKA